MRTTQNWALDIALIHYPVLGKNGETISSSVTNLDLHDIARTARTFGVDNYFVVTPIEDQRLLVEEIIQHWQTGHGAKANPARKEAFNLVRVCSTLDEVVERIALKRKQSPALYITSAKKHTRSISYEFARNNISLENPSLLLFGTAHGLAQDITEKADYILPPICGRTGYNHLSVRSAVSIILDRLLGVHE
jgi:hypothetical protein